MSFVDFNVTKGFLPLSYVLGASKPGENVAAPKAGSSETRAEFLDYARKTPAERMREALLKRLGETEESLKTKDPAERQAIEAEMRRLIEEEVRNDPKNAARTGLFADVRA